MLNSHTQYIIFHMTYEYGPLATLLYRLRLFYYQCHLYKQKILLMSVIKYY